MHVNAVWVHAGVCQINFQRKHFSTYLQNSTFNNCQELLSHIFPCTRTLQAPLGPQFFLRSHCTLVVAFGRPDVTEGPRSDISHMVRSQKNIIWEFFPTWGGVFPNPKTFVNLPSIFLYAKVILRC